MTRRRSAATGAPTSARCRATSSRASAEIQGLARHALALSRLGHHHAEATALVDRALGRLDAQKYLEGSVEEVVAACAAVLHAAGARDRAHALRERGRASARHKLAALPDPAWRAAYAAVPEIAELLG